MKEYSDTFYNNGYHISNQREKIDVLKLNNWEKENITHDENDMNFLFRQLMRFYKKNKKEKKLRVLCKLKDLIDKNNEEISSIINENFSRNNKILQMKSEQNIKEQGTILYNSIAKTKSRFDISLLKIYKYLNKKPNDSKQLWN